MAQLIMCDAHGMEHPADWLVTRMADGEVLAYCNTGYLEFMVAAVRAGDEAEADETAAEAERRLATVQAPGVDGDKLNDELADRLAASNEREVARDTEPAKIVRRGRSARAIAHRAKVAAAANGSTPAGIEPPDPGDDDDDDDEATGDDAPTP